MFQGKKGHVEKLQVCVSVYNVCVNICIYILYVKEKY